MKSIAAVLILFIFARVSSAENNEEMSLEPTPLAFRPFTMRDARQLRSDCDINCNDALDAVTAAISNVDDMIKQLSSRSTQLESDALSITDACSGGAYTAYVSLSSCPGQRSSADYNVAATPPAMQELEMLHSMAPFSSLY